ncbi:hypothetical protein CALCODRAFT_486863 [Calocera cornea HHB12733]|uniref:Alpha-type protein kinase domain-containing protein n=1 Tax=Calocera cornea HHB12733 TaxID=1353952 RepID=A0A165DHH9_9BASI|nr:hypothetical protein CALCODRAFT_486863 [Calocera cornea HHB12733]
MDSDPRKVATKSGSSPLRQGLFVPIPELHWADLIREKKKLVIDYKGKGCDALLRADESAGEMLGKPGTFKEAFAAEITLKEVPIPWENLPEQPFPVCRRTQVACKRRFIRAPGGPRYHPAAKKECCFLEREGNLLFWAIPIHELAKEYVQGFLRDHPDSAASKLELPDTRLVRAGLFRYERPKLEHPSQTEEMVTLIEELIVHDTKAKVKDRSAKRFMKFINNDAPVPRVSDGEAGTVARYLCFFQHVQYEKSGRLALITDYQDFE